MKEYIISIDDTADDWEETFIGYIRKQKELIRCKDCKYAKCIDQNDNWWECSHDKRVMHGDGFCSWAERRNDETS